MEGIGVYTVLWLVAVSAVVPAGATTPPDSIPIAELCAPAAHPRPGPVLPQPLPSGNCVLASSDTGGSQRPKAFEYSHAYEVRLTIHKYASYATLPLFAAEYYLGQKLYTADTAELKNMDGTRNAHQAVATAIGGLFIVNTVTGAWNLWEGRKDPNGRTRRFVHGGLMILAGAGFVATASTAPGGREAERDPAAYQAAASQHKTLAIVSVSTALAGYLMMLIWK